MPSPRAVKRPNSLESIKLELDQNGSPLGLVAASGAALFAALGGRALPGFGGSIIVLALVLAVFSRLRRA